MENIETKTQKRYTFITQDCYEPEKEVSHGLFETFEEAVKFRARWVCEKHGIKNMDDFEEMFGCAKLDDPWFDNVDTIFAIEEVSGDGLPGPRTRYLWGLTTG